MSKEEEITNDIEDDVPPELEPIDAPQKNQNHHGKNENPVKTRYLILTINKNMHLVIRITLLKYLKGCDEI